MSDEIKNQIEQINQMARLESDLNIPHITNIIMSYIPNAIVDIEGELCEVQSGDNEKLSMSNGVCVIHNFVITCKFDLGKNFRYWCGVPPIIKTDDISDMFIGKDLTSELMDIEDWDVSGVENFQGLFLGSKFNGTLEKWDIKEDDYYDGMLCETDAPNICQRILNIYYNEPDSDDENHPEFPPIDPLWRKAFGV